MAKDACAGGDGVRPSQSIPPGRDRFAEPLGRGRRQMEAMTSKLKGDPMSRTSIVVLAVVGMLASSVAASSATLSGIGGSFGGHMGGPTLGSVSPNLARPDRGLSGHPGGPGTPGPHRPPGSSG